MFDAKSILGALLGGAQGQPQGRVPMGGQPSGQGGLGDLLGGLLNQAGGQGQGGGALGNILGQLTQGRATASQPSGQGGGLSDLLGGLLGQATGGLRDAGNRAGSAVGQPNAMNDILAQISGGQGGDIIGKLKQIMEQNPGLASAGLGGLASIVLGTGAGRSLATTAAKIGALALIGGLAYSAWQNAQAGRPPLSRGEQPQIAAAPAGSGFEPEVATNETAVVFIRAMIAAAASDGTIDAAEQAVILGSLKQGGFDAEANDWMQNEMANPATVDDLVTAAGGSMELASQIYTAARLAIHPDQRAEQKFLRMLAAGLEIPPHVVAQIDASTDAAQGSA
ncbi:MAG: tellurite resistance TerB family protein [Beijerinckiaceae bacterium]